MNDTEHFVELVRKYIRVIDNLDSYSAYEFLKKCHELLPLIYAYGFKLPDVEPDSDDALGTLNRTYPMGEIGQKLGKYDEYYDTFDPIFDKKTSVGGLSCDIIEIYQDLLTALVAYEAGKVNDALWDWKFSMQYHSGNHLVRALRAIHWLVNDHMPWDYCSENDKSWQDKTQRVRQVRTGET